MPNITSTQMQTAEGQIVQSQTVLCALTEVEATAPVQNLIDTYARLAHSYELCGQWEAVTTCELLQYQLVGALTLIQELHGLPAVGALGERTSGQELIS